MYVILYGIYDVILLLFNDFYTYQYLRMAMGLSISPAIWQTFINNILRQIPNKNRHIAIMDDCLVHSKFADHLQDLTNLFQSLINNGLKISPKKCQFF